MNPLPYFEIDRLKRSDGRYRIYIRQNTKPATLKTKVLTESKYEQDLEGASADGPHYKLAVDSIDEFEEYYDRITRDIPREQRVELRFVERIQESQMLH